MKTWVVAAALFAVARVAVPTAPPPAPTPARLPNLGSDLPPPVYVETSSVVKLNGRLPPPIVSIAAHTVPTGMVTMRAEQSLRMILAQAREAPPQGGVARGSARDGGNPGGGSRNRQNPDLPTGLDPDRNLFQEDGIDALKDEDEADVTANRGSPLASAYPDSFIVVCEAGCRPSSNKIVYEVSKIAAAAADIAKRKLETTAVEPTDGSKDAASVENTVVCVAGCYRDEKPQPQRAETKKAEQPPAVEPAKKQKTRFAAAGPHGRRIAEHIEPVRTRAVRPVAVADAQPAGIAASKPVALAVVAPKPLEAKTVNAAKAAAARTSRQDLRARSAAKTVAKRSTKKARDWLTTVAKVEDDHNKPEQPVVPDHGPTLARTEAARQDDAMPPWQTSLVSTQGGNEPNEVSTGERWGYVIRVAP